MIKLNLSLKHISIGMKSFFNYIAPKMIWLSILKNVAIYLFKYFVSHIVRHVSIVEDKSKFLVLHNFMKCFSGSWVNQIVVINIWMICCLIFWICYFWLGKKMMFTKLLLHKERMIINKNILKIITLSNNLLLAWKF